MRLLNVESRQLHTFYKNVPPYAILSHTWDQTEPEVSYQDMQRPDHARMKGYSKIDNTCRQAELDGIDWVWIDTCCIERSSSAELSEAINTMFRWYRESTICYAYLEDILHNNFLTDPHSSKPSKQCRWFTRGWTLQELLAPRRMTFYDKEWTRIDDRASIAEEIERRTSIPAMFLTGTDFRKARVAQRMSWASHRDTTREEDVAYCLLGLFSINMPLLYGEGGEKAFRRLQEEILRTSGDHSILAWLDADAVPPLASSPPPDASSPQTPLAPSPSMFRCQRKHMPPVLGAPTPCEITSHGIRLDLQIYEEGRVFVGLLNAAIDLDINRGVSALTLRVTEQPGVYERVGYQVVDRKHLRSCSRTISLRWPDPYAGVTPHGINWAQRGPVLVSVDRGLDDMILATDFFWDTPFSEVTHPREWKRMGVHLRAASRTLTLDKLVRVKSLRKPSKALGRELPALPAPSEEFSGEPVPKNSISEYFLVIERQHWPLSCKVMFIDCQSDLTLERVVRSPGLVASVPENNNFRQIKQISNSSLFGASLHKITIAHPPSDVDRDSLRFLRDFGELAETYWETTMACVMTIRMADAVLNWLLTDDDNIKALWKFIQYALKTSVLAIQGIVVFTLALCAALYLSMHPKHREGPFSLGSQVLALHRAFCIGICLTNTALICADVMPLGISQPWEFAGFLSFWARLSVNWSNFRRLRAVLWRRLKIHPMQAYISLSLAAIPLGKYLYHM